MKPQLPAMALTPSRSSSRAASTNSVSSCAEVLDRISLAPDAAQDPADNGEIEGKGISELPRRFGEQRIKAEDADWGVVVQVTAGYPHSALPWRWAPDEGPDDLS